MKFGKKMHKRMHGEVTIASKEGTMSEPFQGDFCSFVCKEENVK